MNTSAEQDTQLENVLLQNQYLPLYEELSFMMNYGDIGGVEVVFLPWIRLFRACGKHKYATCMTQLLHDLYSVYPEGLRKTIRMNILVNPSGKPGRFRGVDWVIEVLNLYIKVRYSSAVTCGHFSY
ncbi:hypothetical protein BDV98DRAFT_516712 [Pterulicium gracile]|uniref:DUF6589 domain-containing protein n=1 Tax=Pterulicium gracile TaxID=1884261 RepID=A0A5C3Q382_9AGAR|nr:hypothetical protein BDV98DRAFT_516712 [Pterula gracilis]